MLALEFRETEVLACEMIGNNRVKAICRAVGFRGFHLWIYV